MLNYILLLFAIFAALIVVAVAIDYFPGRNRRRRRGSGGFWNTPELYDHDVPDHRHHHDDNDGGGWFDGGGDFDAGD